MTISTLMSGDTPTTSALQKKSDNRTPRIEFAFIQMLLKELELLLLKLDLTKQDRGVYTYL